MSEDEAQRLLDLYESEDEVFSDEETEEILEALEEMRAGHGVPWEQVKEKLNL